MIVNLLNGDALLEIHQIINSTKKTRTIYLEIRYILKECSFILEQKKVM